MYEFEFYFQETLRLKILRVHLKPVEKFFYTKLLVTIIPRGFGSPLHVSGSKDLISDLFFELREYSEFILLLLNIPNVLFWELMDCVMMSV